MAIPTFGQSGDSVRAYQPQLNTQNSGQKGYVSLKTDGVFGAKTQAASTFQVPNTGNSNATAPGATTSAGPTPTNNMNVGSLTTPTALQGTLTPPTPAPVNTQEAVTYAQMAQQGITALDNSQNQTNQNDAFSQFLKDTTAGTNKAADVATANETYGVNKNRQQVQDYANQIIANTAGTAVDKLSVGQNVGGITSTDRQGFESEIDRTRAIKALTLGAQLQAAQGNLSVAEGLSKQAIDAKYEPIEKKLENIKTFLTLNKDNLNRDQEKQLALTNAKIKDTEVTKSNEKDVNSIALEIAKNGGDATKIAGATNLSEAISKAGDSLRSKSTELVKLGDKAAYLIDKNTGKIIRSFGSSGEGGSTKIGGSNGAQYAGVVNTILASGKFTKEQASAVRNAINNGEDPFTVVKNNAKNIMGQTEATTLSKYEASKSALSDLDTALSAYYAAGGKTSLFSGTLEKTINKLGEVKDPAVVDLATQVAAQIQVYRNAVSGTAYSAQEGSQIDSVFPGINKTEGLNKAIISGRNKAFDSAINGVYRTAIGNTYDKLKSLEDGSGAGAKNGIDDRSFVEKAVKSAGKTYESLVNGADASKKEIPVVDNATGKVGYIPFLEFNSSKYTKL